MAHHDDNALDDLLEGDAPEPADVRAAAAAEAHVTDQEQYGHPGPPLDGRSPFVTGVGATLGVAAAAIGVLMVYYSRGILLLLLLALFIALGLDPLVGMFHRRLSRPMSVLAVILLLLLLAGGIGTLVVPVVTKQITDLVNQLPHYFNELNSRSSIIGRFNRRYHLEKTIQNALTKKGYGNIATGLLGVGRRVLGGLVDTVIVIVVSIYLLLDLPRVKRLFYSLTPRSRRARTVLLGDEIFAKVGGYVLGRVVIAVIGGLGTYVWCAIFGVPFPLLLAVLVAVFGLIPIIGSTVGGFVVAVVALTVSVPIAVATAAFYIVYRLIEDYVITPPIMNKTVDVPGLVSVIATLIGGALLGIIGALIAIPVAAAVKLIIEQVIAPRLEQS